MTLALLRFAIAAIALIPVKQRLAPREGLALRDIPIMSGAGLVGVTLYFLFENYGVKLTTASESSLIIATIPILTLLAEALVSRRGSHWQLTRLQWIGAFLSFGGVTIIVGKGLRLSGSAGGYLFMFGAALSWVVYTFLTRELFRRYSRITVVFWQTLFGLVALIPLAALDVGAFGTPNLGTWLNVAYLGIACSALGYWFFACALDELGVVTCSVYINLIPVVTVTTGALMGERLTLLQLMGGGLVIWGIFLATTRKQAHSTESRLASG
jgi:drug/metabolite transporter (DMT)-like permease